MASSAPLRLALVLSLSLACSCRPNHERPAAATTLDEATQELARCAFDNTALILSDRGAPAIEASIRRALHVDRYAFSVRAGRCVSALSESLRQRDPRARELADAWEALLPKAQSPTPNDIDIERAIRRVGVRWRAARSAAH